MYIVLLIERYFFICHRSFKLDKHAVTNEQFRDFVQSTGYKTEAELFRWIFSRILLSAE